MDLPELLSRVNFDRKFKDMISKESLSFDKLLEKYKMYNASSGFQLRADLRERGNIYLAIGEKGGVTFFLETQESRAARLKNASAIL